MKKIAILAVLGIMPLIGAFAQQDTTVNRTVIVENEYNPTVMDASKINVMPQMNEPKATKKNINYATSLRPVSAWGYQAMSPVVREWESATAYRGYLRGGYGNNGNVDLAAGYLWDISKRDRLNVSASLDGWNGDLKNRAGEDWNSRLYNTKLGLDYRHAFKKFDFLLGGSYRSQVFNYMWNSLEKYTEAGDRQHQTLGNVYLGVASTDKELAVQYQGEVGLEYFSQKYPSIMEVENEKNFYLESIR